MAAAGGPPGPLVALLVALIGPAGPCLVLYLVPHVKVIQIVWQTFDVCLAGNHLICCTLSPMLYCIMAG